MAIRKIYIPQAFVELQRELCNHPDLQDKLIRVAESGGTWTEQLATLAAEFNIIVDGYYEPGDIHGLVELLIDKLVIRRSGILLT